MDFFKFLAKLAIFAFFWNNCPFLVKVFKSILITLFGVVILKQSYHIGKLWQYFFKSSLKEPDFFFNFLKKCQDGKKLKYWFLLKAINKIRSFLQKWDVLMNYNWNLIFVAIHVKKPKIAIVNRNQAKSCIHGKIWGLKMYISFNANWAIYWRG